MSEGPTFRKQRGHSMKITAAVALAGLVVTTAPAYSWNEFGHWEVAAVAWSKLEPATRARAVALLKKNPKFDTWVKGIPADERDQFAFVRAATFADDIKSDPEYHTDGPHNGNRPPHTPQASQ